MGFITCENLSDFAYTNEHLLTGRPLGLVAHMHGLGRGQRLREDFSGGVYLAKRNILFVYPYSSVWGWGNEASISYADECIDCLLEKYGRDLPVCIIGSSMGGFSALVYAYTTKRKLVACAADCPVCDLNAAFDYMTDVRQTFYTAYCDKPDFPAYIAARSPLSNIEKFPKIPYYILHGTQDTNVPKTAHSDKFVSLMRAAGYDVAYACPDTAHNRYTDESFAAYYGFIANAVLNKG